MGTDIVKGMNLAVPVPNYDHGSIGHIQAAQLVVTGLGQFFGPGNVQPDLPEDAFPFQFEQLRVNHRPDIHRPRTQFRIAGGIRHGLFYLVCRGCHACYSVKISRGRKAETTKLGTSTISDILRSTATLHIA